MVKGFTLTCISSCCWNSFIFFLWKINTIIIKLLLFSLNSRNARNVWLWQRFQFNLLQICLCCCCFFFLILFIQCLPGLLDRKFTWKVFYSFSSYWIVLECFFFLILFIIIKTLKISTLFYIRHPKVVSVQETTFNFIKVLSLMFLFFWIAYKIDFTDKICNCILLLLLHRSRYFHPHFKFPFHQRFHQLIFIVHFIFEKKKKTIYIEFKNIVSNSTRNCNV